MRFFVEVSPIGKNETHTSCVEADSWQKALQAARELRGEQGPISGFSIELVEDGCRAVDPLARLRYVVKRAPADAPLTAAAAAGAPGAPKIEAPKEAAKEAPKPNLGGKTLAFGSQSATVAAARTTGPTPSAANPARTTGPTPSAANPARTTGPTPSAANPARTTGPTPSAANPARTTGPVASAANPARSTGPVAKGTATDDVVTTPSVPPVDETRVLHRRFEDASPASPITYREEVYALAEGATEDDAEGLLLTQFGHVLRTVHRAPAGKFIHLAVFDAVFEGEPPAPPLATLVWKDWKGAEPVIAFPRRVSSSKLAAQRAAEREKPVAQAAPAQAAPAPTPAAAIAAVAEAIAKASHPPPAPAPASGTPSSPPRPAQSVPPAGIAAIAESLARASQPPAPIPLTQPAIPHNPVPNVAAVEATPGAPAAAPPVQAAPPAPAPVAATPEPPPAAAPPLPKPASVPQQPIAVNQAPNQGPSSTQQIAAMRQRLSSRPSSGSMQAARLRSDELIAVLFESMHDLHFARDSVEGAEFCLALLLEKLPSKGGIVHFYDMEAREFVIAAAYGANVDKLLLRRHPASDPLLSAALRQKGSFIVNDAATNDSTFVERLELLGSAKRVLAAPVMSGNRCLGAIEIMNPLDGGPYTDEEANALQYMTEQLAEFVGSHGLVLDPARIQRGAAAAAQ